jgi:hypothetical protein
VSLLSKACLVGSMACTVACSAIGHHCEFDVPLCDQTRITLQSPNNAWAAGTYKLTLNDGTARACTLTILDPPSAGSPDGSCTSTDTNLTLTQVCGPPGTACNEGACTEIAPNCLPGQFEIEIDVVAPVSAQVALELEVDGLTLMNETITLKTTEPNGAGCGMCTNASATVSIMDK